MGLETSLMHSLIENVFNFVDDRDKSVRNYLAKKVMDNDLGFVDDDNQRLYIKKTLRNWVQLYNRLRSEGFGDSVDFSFYLTFKDVNEASNFIEDLTGSIIFSRHVRTYMHELIEKYSYFM